MYPIYLVVHCVCLLFLLMANCWFSDAAFRLRTNTESRNHLFVRWTECIQWMPRLYLVSEHKINKQNKTTFAQRVTSCAGILFCHGDPEAAFSFHHARLWLFAVLCHYYCQLWDFSEPKSVHRTSYKGNWCLQYKNDTVYTIFEAKLKRVGCGQTFNKFVGKLFALKQAWGWRRRRMTITANVNAMKLNINLL